jgi:hypothetical protein
MPVNILIAPQLSPANLSAEALWVEIEKWTLEACVLRAEGHQAEGIRVLEKRLPELIRRWSASCGLANPEIQLRLRQMFAETHQVIARALAQRRIVTANLLTRRNAPASSSTGSSGTFGLRERIPFADVAGMLDGLVEAEREARREAIWPLRSPATYLAGQTEPFR